MTAIRVHLIGVGRKSMWIDVDAIVEAERQFEAAGRALAVAQHFESACKDLLRWMHVAKAAEDGRAKTLQEFRSCADEFVGLMLGSTVKRFGLDHDITKEELETLVKAKNARNYIAHECIAECSYHSRFSRFPPELEARFESEVRALVAGDSLVSSWSFMFHEGQTPPGELMLVYPEQITQWVLAPLA